MRPAVDDVVALGVAARTLANVMVTAGDGAERTALARWIHDGSSQRLGRFISVFPGRKQHLCVDDVDEWFARAAGGTLFIDRIGQLSYQAQDRLLWLLTEQAHRLATPGPGHRVRVVAGSNGSLRADLDIGTFSDALFYRLNVIHIDMMHHDEAGVQADSEGKPAMTGL